MGFSKLFASITQSSLWSESKDVRILFVSLLANCDQEGFVEASVPGLARLANLSLPETEAALETLKAPDPHSKNPANEGRRVAAIPGGFCVLNHGDYRNRRGEEDRREYMRKYMQAYRKKCKQEHANGVNNPVNDVNNDAHQLTRCKPDTDAEDRTDTEAEEEAEELRSSRAEQGSTPTADLSEISGIAFPLQSGVFFLKPDQANEYARTYRDYNFPLEPELRKCAQWYRDHPSRRPRGGRSMKAAITRWLNRTAEGAQVVSDSSQLGGKIEDSPAVAREKQRGRQIRALMSQGIPKAKAIEQVDNAANASN